MENEAVVVKEFNDAVTEMEKLGFVFHLHNVGSEFEGILTNRDLIRHVVGSDMNETALKALEVARALVN